jgi:glyoxylase-like metal-dependent hydrolase (beta-lactamase superfamily II)
MVKIREVGRNVYLIDDELYSIPGCGAVYFLAEKKKTLIDTGPATSAGVILSAIQYLGFKASEVDYLILTHIHLDHAGGAGTLLTSMPQAKVVAHPKALKHLIDPAKLVNSAIAAQGEKTMIRNGEVLPIGNERLVPANDRDTIKLSNQQTLTLLDCPGHAPHEIVIYESRSGGIFVGDAVGHFIEGTDVMIPITPPPSFEMELFLKTLERLASLKASQIYFAHAGTSTDVAEKLTAAARKLQERNAVIEQSATEHQIEKAAARLNTHILSELEFMKKDLRPIYDYWAEVDIPMSAAEHVRYYRQKHNL